MFHDEEDRRPVARVESIIEVGGMGAARLELYYIELYENSEIRIVSLYGREFERH
jgi:hypothetical protein